MVSVVNHLSKINQNKIITSPLDWECSSKEEHLPKMYKLPRNTVKVFFIKKLKIASQMLVHTITENVSHYNPYGKQCGASSKSPSATTL